MAGCCFYAMGELQKKIAWEKARWCKGGKSRHVEQRAVTLCLLGFPVSAEMYSNRNEAMLIRHEGSLSTCGRVGLEILFMSNVESGWCS